MNREYYIQLSEKFKPNEIRLIFLLESPPISGKYFYNIDGIKSEPLYREMMKVFEIKTDTKKEGLKKFCDNGCYLIDAAYTPVNNINNKSQRKAAILKEYSTLVSDLRVLTDNNNIPIIIVKTTLYDLLNDKLKKDGFNIINGEIRLPFPARHPNVFRVRLKSVLSNNSLKY